MRFVTFVLLFLSAVLSGLHLQLQSHNALDWEDLDTLYYFMLCDYDENQLDSAVCDNRAISLAAEKNMSYWRAAVWKILE